MGVRGQWLKHALKEVEGDLSRVVEKLMEEGPGANGEGAAES